jgi:hypothetical protein
MDMFAILALAILSLTYAASIGGLAACVDTVIKFQYCHNISAAYNSVYLTRPEAALNH